MVAEGQLKGEGPGFSALRRTAITSAFSWSVMKRSMMVMLLVGSALNLINQGDALWSPAAINWWELFLTYCVPFCVATCGAYGAFSTSAKLFRRAHRLRRSKTRHDLPSEC